MHGFSHLENMSHLMYDLMCVYMYSVCTLYVTLRIHMYELSNVNLFIFFRTGLCQNNIYEKFSMKCGAGRTNTNTHRDQTRPE